MHEVGVRELKNSLSELLRRAARGERVRVTAHGRPLADIVPAADDTDSDRLRELVDDGRLTRATRPRPQHPPRLLRGSRLASALVIEERRAGR